MVIIGYHFKDQCPVNYKIPVWLILTGIYGILLNLEHLSKNFYYYRYNFIFTTT